MRKRRTPIVAVAALASIVCRGAQAGQPEKRVEGAQAPSHVEIEAGYAEVPGGRLFYEVTGSGDTLVLIHGNIGDRRHWDHQFEALAQKLRVVRYDVRGFGRSSLPEEGKPYTDHEDLAAILDHLDISRAHIAGWSMGSGIAVDFVLGHPERAASLIPIGPWVSRYSSPAAQSMYADMDAVRAALAEGGATAAVDAWMEAPFFATTIRDASAGSEFRNIAGDYSWWSWSHTNPRRFLEPRATRRIGEIRVPTLILTAEHDVPACLEIADLLDQTVADSRKVVMVGTGHLLHMEKPEGFNQHLLDFVSALGGE